jgi:hypothetical protein
MTRPPFRAAPNQVAPKTDEEIAHTAMHDIKANATGAADQWKPYDERYVLQRILRAIREAKDVHPLSKVPADVLLPAMRDAVKKARGK